MFPFWAGARSRIAETLRKGATTFRMRVIVAIAFACFHLLMFSCAAHDRLGIPFNIAPETAPYYSDIHAPATIGYPRQPHHWSRLVVSRWDSEHYIGFALRGLSSCPAAPLPDKLQTDLLYLECGLGWFPTWGLVAGAIAQPFDWPVDVVLVVMGLIATIVVNLIWTSQAIMRRLGELEAYAALVACNLFPSAFHFVTPYTESATLALGLVGLWFLAKDRWLLAGIAVGAATGLRAGAISFVPGFAVAALYAAHRKYRAGDDRWYIPFVAVALSAWGLLAQLLMFQIVVGDWSAYFRARELFGDRRDYGRLFDPEFYLEGLPAQHLDGVMLAASLALVALSIRELARKLPAPELLFLAGSGIAGVVLDIVAHTQQYWGLNRYLLLCPIIFAAAGVAARKHRAIYALWIVFCLAMYWHVELCSYVSQGDPRVCPCLGKFEFWAPFQS